MARSASAGSRTFTANNRLRDGLVVSEIAIAFVLVVSAALLMRTLASIRAVDPGFRTVRVLTAQINVPASRKLAENQRFYSEVLSQVRAVPGVESAGLTSISSVYVSREHAEYPD